MPAILQKDSLFSTILHSSKAGIRCLPEERKVTDDMTQKREFFRVAIERTGQIARGAEIAPCEVLDLTEKGFQLRTGLSVAVGERLELEFHLTKAVPIQCTVEITHAASPNSAPASRGFLPSTRAAFLSSSNN